MSSSFQPIDQVPYAIEFPDVQDWDDPPTCILWPEFRSTLQYVRSQGSLPPLHNSHDHLNKQIEVDVDSAVEARWREAFEKLTADKAGEGVELVWFIVDGFVLYWDEVRDFCSMLRREINGARRRLSTSLTSDCSCEFHTRSSNVGETRDKSTFFRVSSDVKRLRSDSCPCFAE